MIVDTHTRIWHSTDQLGPQIAADIQQRYTDPTDRLDASEQAHNEATADNKREQLDRRGCRRVTHDILMPRTAMSSV